MERGRPTRLHGLTVRKFRCTNTSVLIGCRLTTRTATAWTIGARISVEVKRPPNRNVVDCSSPPLPQILAENPDGKRNGRRPQTNPWRHRRNLRVPETVCAGWQAITSARDGVSRQHRFGRGSYAPDRFALALVETVMRRQL